MTEDTILMSCSCGSSGGCSTTGCTGDAATCSADPCCRKGDADAKAEADANDCPKCGSELKSGLKYTDICLECEPVYKARCGGCQRILWDCMCIKPHTWE